ncbi:MAG: Hsp33 family molecular chaperone HslO [Alphaproteobacteria bacterium]|nr:Hsp33 family molecular chaperone HslO [Alphaproteobacteria bacterium]
MRDGGGGGDDLVLPFQIDAGAFRGRVVRLGPALGDVLARHDYPDAVASMLGETLVLAVTLAGMLKYEGVFSLQIQGDGPIRLLVADVTSGGDVRAHASYDRLRLEQTELARAGAGVSQPVPWLLGAGFLAFTVDQGPNTDRYQGIVELTGGTLSDCAHQYFRQSEQLETAIKLVVQGPGSGGWRAAALMLQRMPAGAGEMSPEEADEAWRTAVILLGSCSSTELLFPALAPEQLLYRLFHQESLLIAQPRLLRARCRCSRQRVEDTLRSFPRSEIDGMRQNDGMVVVVCEFCKTRYDFADGDLDTLYST